MVDVERARRSWELGRRRFGVTLKNKAALVLGTGCGVTLRCIPGPALQHTQLPFLPLVAKTAEGGYLGRTTAKAVELAETAGTSIPFRCGLGKSGVSHPVRRLVACFSGLLHGTWAARPLEEQRRGRSWRDGLTSSSKPPQCPSCEDLPGDTALPPLRAQSAGAPSERMAVHPTDHQHPPTSQQPQFDCDRVDRGRPLRTRLLDLPDLPDLSEVSHARYDRHQPWWWFCAATVRPMS